MRFAGFESTTYDLQRNQWQLAVENDYRNYGLQLAIKHTPTGFTGISQSVDFNQLRMIRSSPYDWADTIIFNIRSINAQTYIQVMHDKLNMNFTAIDATPQLVEMPKKFNLEDLILFKPLLIETELIVKPDDMEVRELLKIIESKQEVTMKDVRERQRKRQARANLNDEISGDRQIMAQIISII